MNNRLSYFCSRVLFIGVGLSYMFDLNNTNILISMILGLGLGYIIIDKTRYNNHKILIITLLIGVGSTACNLCHTLYLENTSLLFIVIFTMFIAFMISFINRKAFIKLSDNMFKWSILLFVLMSLSLIPFVNLNYLKPYSFNNNKCLFESSLLFTGISILPSYILNEKNKKEYLIGSISTIVLSFLIITVLGTKEASLYRYPEYVVLKRIRFLDFISNFENIFFFIILVDLIITLSLCYNKLIKRNRLYDTILFVMTIVVVYIINFYQKILNIIFYTFPYFIILSLIMTIIPKKTKYKTKKESYDIYR